MVTKENIVVAKGHKWGTLYMVEFSDAEEHDVDEVKASTLWHQRLRYMSEKGMNMLSSKGRISNMKKCDSKFL